MVTSLLRKLKLAARLALIPPCALLLFTGWSGAQRRSADGTSTGFDDVVFAISFSPDGRTLAIARGASEPAQRFGRVELWDTDSERLRHVIKGFDGPVRSVSFSPDSQTLLSGSTEFRSPKIKEKTRSREGETFGELKWWDTQTGELKHKLTLPGDGSFSLNATWSPDGSQLALVETFLQFSFFLNNPNFGAGLANPGPLDNPAFRNRPLLNYSADLKLLDAQTGETKLKLKTSQPHGATFSPDGTLLAVESGSEVKVWNTTTGQEEHKLKGFKGRPNALAFSPDGRTLAVAAAKHDRQSSGRYIKLMVDSEVKLFDVRTWNADGQAQNLGAVNSWLLSRAAGFSLIGVCSIKGRQRFCGQTSRFTNGEDEGYVSTGEDYSSAVEFLAISRQGHLLAFRAGQNLVRLLDTQTWKIKQTLDANSAGEDNQRSVSRFLVTVNRVTALAFLPDGNTVTGEIEGHGLKLWDTRTGEIKKRVEDKDSESSLVAISSNGATLAAAAEDATLNLWNIEDNRKSVIPRSDSDSVSALALSTTGQLIAAGSSRELAVWDVRSGKKLFALSGHQSAITGVVFSSDDQMLASADESGTITLWELKTGQSERSIKTSGKVTALRFAPTGQLLASAGEDKTISLWDLRTGGLQVKLRKHDGAINAIAFSPDGQLLASGSDDRTVIIWETASGKSRRTLKGHDQTVLSLAFSPDGSIIASGSGNASVVLWDVRTGKVNRVLR
jgi:WD40 repeat protein